MFGTPFTTLLPRCHGKILSAIVLDDNLVLKFTDGTQVGLQDTGQSCCEHRYLHSDDDLAYYVGAALEDVDLEEGPTENKDYEIKECMFLRVTTSRGVFTICSYNKHNGYYGGISIEEF